MKTVTETIENNLLEIEDIEKALSSYLDEEVRISDVECTLVHSIPARCVLLICSGTTQSADIT